MATQMAATRQPFAPLNGSRLSNLTSLKNRQNAITTLTSSTKRKAQTYESDFSNDDAENIDPVNFLSPKRSKCPDGSSKDTLCKPITNFFLTRAPPSPTFSSVKATGTPMTSPRKVLAARSPMKVDTRAGNGGSHSAPAGRSPTRKRIGILNRRRTTTRIDPPAFGTASAGLGFSIDAALSGTIPSYTPKPRAAPAPAAPISMPLSEGMAQIPALHTGGEAKASWFFDIHEDTEEELATNLMEHGACTLDISSDEETSRRERDNRGKENVPPPDDVSQTRSPLSGSSDGAIVSVVGETEREELAMHAAKQAFRKRRALREGEIEIDRAPLGDLAAEEFYAEGCDGASVFVILAEEEAEQEQEPQAEQLVEARVEIDIDVLMQKSEMDIAPVAALLEPIEKPEEGANFEVWESGSAKGDE